MNKPTKALAVLIVEDSESDAQLVVRLLKKADYELVYEQVETAEQMRTALGKRAWDIVISDYRLPQFDGRAALKLLQEMGRDIPFIVLSGTIGEEVAVAMMKAGAHDYLIKGDLARLVPAVERELAQTEVRRERKQAADALKQSEAQYRLLADHMADMVWLMDLNLKTTYISPSIERIRGYTLEELQQLPLDQNLTPASFQLAMEVFSAEMPRVMTDTTYSVEKTLELEFYLKGGGTVWMESKLSIIRDENGNPLSILGEGRDITERKQAEAALHKSEERYRSLFDRMLDGIYRSTHEGKFVDINPAMVKMFGYSSREEMLAIDIKKELYFDPAERGSHILDTGQQEIDVYRMRRKDGSEIWVEDRGYYIHDEQGRIIFHEGMLRDVTEQVQARNALAASEAELRALFASMQDVVLVIDRNGVYRKIAPTKPGLLVKPPMELFGKNLRDVFPAEQAESFLGTVRQVLNTSQTAPIEYELLIGDRKVWFEAFISPMGKDSTLWVARDVSGRKQAEEALRRTEELLRVYVSNAPLIVSSLDRHGIWTLSEGAGLKLLDRQPGEVVGQSIFEVNRDFPQVLEAVRGALAGEERAAVVGIDDHYFDVRYVPIRAADGEVTGVAGVTMDITERKQAEDALRESERRYKMVSELASDYIYKVGVAADGKISLDFVTDSFYTVTGRSIEQARTLESWSSIFHPDDLPKAMEFLRGLIFTQQPGEFECRTYVGDNQMRWVEIIARPEWDEQENRVTAIVGAVKDITARRQAEEALRESEERFRSVFENVSIGLYRTTPDGRILLANTTFARMLGCESVGELMQRNKDGGFILIEYPRAEFLRLMESEGEVRGFETHGKRMDGTVIFFRENAKAVRDSDGKILYFEGAVEDITERKQAEDALRESEDRYRALVEQIPAITYIDKADGSGSSLFVSPQIESILGFSPEEWKQGDAVFWATVIHPDDRERVLAAYQHSIDTGQPFNEEYRMIARDGREVWIDDHAALLKAAGGQPASFQGVMFDITAHKQVEMEIRQRLAEQGIIHQVSQSLLSARLDLDAIYTSLHEAVARLMPCDAFSIVLDDPNGGDHYAVYLYDAGLRYPARRILRGQGLSGRIISTGETLFIHDLLQSQASVVHFGSPESVRSILAVPLRKDNEVVGMIAAQSYQPNVYEERQRLLLETLAAQVTAVIENARLYEKVQNELTERVQAEEALRASEERYRELFNSMIDGFALHEIICDESEKPVDYRFLEVNPAFERMTGLQAANLIGKTVLEVMPNTESYWIEIYGNVALTGRSTFFENYSGELGRHFEVSAYCPRPGQFAVIMVDITERKQAEQDLRQHVTELEVLYESGLALGRLLNPKEIGWKMIELMKEKLGWHHTVIRLYHPEDESLELLVFNQPGLANEAEGRAVEEHFNKLISKSGDGLSGWAVQQSRTIRSGDVRSEPHYIETYPGICSGLYVPMKLGEHMIGVICVESEQSDAFSEADEHLLTTLANQAASALENARLFEVTRQRVIELETLYQSGLALSQLLNPKEIGQKILELLDEKLGWRHTRIRLYRPQDDSLELLDFNQPGLRGELERREMIERFQTLISRSGQGISGWVVKHGQPVRSGDISNDPRYIEAYPGLRSGLYVPMKLGERIIGVIGIESEQPDAFSDADERLLATLANQAASAFENAHLFEVARQRVMEVETLNRISLVLRAVSKQDEMLSIVLDEALAILNTSHGSIELWDDTNDILLKKVVRGWFAQVIESPQKGDEGISGRVITSGEIYISREFASDPIARAESRNQLPPGWGGACLPIRTAQQVLGVLVVSVPSECELNRDEIRLLSTLAEMTGAALHRMQLFDETARRAEEFASLYETSKILSVENKLDSLLQSIVEHAKTLLHAASSGIYLYDKENEELEVVVDSHNAPYPVTGARLRLGEGAAGRVAQTRQPLRIEDYSTWEGGSRKYTDVPFRAILEVPMLYGGELIGVLTADEIKDSKRKFTEADERLLSLFASQAAGAIHSARLHEETVRRAEEFASLYETSKSLSAKKELDALLRTIVEHARALLHSTSSGIYLYDKEREELEVVVEAGDTSYSPPGIRLRLGEGATGLVAQTRQPLRIEDYSTWEGRSEKYAGIPYRALMEVPVLYGGELVGVLTADEIGNSVRKFSEADERLLSLFASQVAGAIHSAQLFEETARRAEEFASLYETSKILSAENELDTLLQTIVEHAQTLLNSSASGIYFYDEVHQEVKIAVYTVPEMAAGTRQGLGEGFAGRVAQIRQPLRVDDYSTWEGRLSKFAGIPFRAVLGVPMLYGGELIGVLVVDEIGDSERKFSESDERLLSLFALQAAGAIHSARLYEETVHRLEHLQALRAVDQAIASSLDMRLTLNILLTHTLPQLGADAADVLLLHPGSNLLEVASSRGFRTRLLENVTVNESFAGRAVMEHHIVAVSDIEIARRNSQFERLWKEEGFSAYWCVPLIVKGEVRGVLEVYRRTAFTPNPEWLEFLEILAGQAAIAIDNTQLFENLQRANTDLILAYNATIEGWSRALDLRDKETEGHTQRVADLTVAIAKAMGVKEQEILHIRRGALLHDIGKMGIPDYILLKPDKLTDEEWAIMRTHPQLARDLLMPIAYLRDALDIPYSHHEKWDGTGYPQGLKGLQIPATARFFAVVDVWDALTSNRPYRKKWTKKKALTYIQEQSGRHFDPRVVDAFVKIVKVK